MEHTNSALRTKQYENIEKIKIVIFLWNRGLTLAEEIITK